MVTLDPQLKVSHGPYQELWKSEVFLPLLDLKYLDLRYRDDDIQGCSLVTLYVPIGPSCGCLIFV